MQALIFKRKAAFTQAKEIKTAKTHKQEKLIIQNKNPFEQTGRSLGNKTLFLMFQSACYVKIIARRKAAYKDNFLSLMYNKVFI